MKRQYSLAEDVMNKLSEKIYCAFCKIPRKVYAKKHISWTNIWLSMLAAALVMLIFWQKFSPKVAVIFVIFMAVTEGFIQLRWRLSIACPHCGFDPVLYLRDQKQALSRVQEILAERKNSPQYLFSTKNPFANLARRAEPAKTLLQQKQEQLLAAARAEAIPSTPMKTSKDAIDLPPNNA